MNVDVPRGLIVIPCHPSLVGLCGAKYGLMYFLVGGLEHFLFSHILGIIIPID